jgi:hypothetical protein
MDVDMYVYALIAVIVGIALTMCYGWYKATVVVDELRQTLHYRHKEFAALRDGAMAMSRLTAQVSKSGHIIRRSEAEALERARSMLGDMCKLDEDGV